MFKPEHSVYAGPVKSPEVILLLQVTLVVSFDLT